LSKEHLEKPKPTLLIRSDDLTSSYYEEIKFFSAQIDLKVAVLEQTTLFPGHKYLILNNQPPLPKEEQFKRNIFGHQIPTKPSDMNYPEREIRQWKAQYYDKDTLIKNLFYYTEDNFPLLISLGDENCSMILIDKVDSHLSKLINNPHKFLLVYPHISVIKRRKLLLIENHIIAVLNSVPNIKKEEAIFSSNQHYKEGTVSEIPHYELEALKFLAEKFKFGAAWMIEYFIDSKKKIHLIKVDYGYDLNIFVSICSQPIVRHIINKLLEQYFNDKLQTCLLNTIYQIENIYQRFNLIAAYHLNLRIEPIDESLEVAKLSHLGTSVLISRCAYGENALSPTFKEKYTCKKKFQNRVVQKHPEVIIPTVYLSNNYTKDKIEKFISEWSFPLVLKPDEGISCNNLFINLNNIEEIIEAHQKILASGYKCSLLQPKLQGLEYRVTLIGEMVVGIAKKMPAILIGDGQSNLHELIQRYNAQYQHYINEACNVVENNFYITLDPDKPDFRTVPNIKINEELTTFLAEKKLSLESVLGKNTSLELLHVNISGAVWENAWGEIEDHLLEKIRQVHVDYGLKINGADVLITNKNELKIFEFNCYPGIMFHHFILKGKPEPAIQAVYKYLFKMQ
jgi:hypothetical protein